MIATTESRSIPFCPQQPINGATRTCGAAALAMVYGSFGTRMRLADVWQSIAVPSVHQEARARTHLLAADALACGRSAACLQASRDPFGTLHKLMGLDWRVIVSHRLEPASVEGHYSVLVDVRTDSIILHDPLRGPNRRLAITEFAPLWLASGGEVAGGVLVAIQASSAAKREVCPTCGGAFPLPRELGVGWTGRWSSRWAAAFCPSCDAQAAPTNERTEQTA